jgi:DNA processing protein
VGQESHGVTWSDAAARLDVGRLWSELQREGIAVAHIGSDHFPSVLQHDPRPPGVLFFRGNPQVLDAPLVAVVGTRNCTSYGREVAFELGRDLVTAGVTVVSGLALGIDGAAHAGALSAGDLGYGPAGVAASGVDVPYPRRHAGLWRRVAERGVILSESAPGQPAQRWRFPARNRIIAGLVRLVVVVESRESGGSMLTVSEALERGVDVGVVPGPVTSPASAGTNRLLVEGAFPIRHAGDVLDSIGRIVPWTLRGGGQDPPGKELNPTYQRVLDAVDWTPTPTGTIVSKSGLGIGATCVALRGLSALGMVRDGGGWWERCRAGT